jgi:glycosyltransferase involved in cell wall biosynthesis
MLHGNLAAQITGTVLGIPVLWSVRHSKLIPGRETKSARFLAWAMKYMSGLPFQIVYNSHEGRLHHEALGYNARAATVIPNGFDLCQFEPDESARTHHRMSLGVAPLTTVIGMVARYHPMKDHATLLNAARLVCEQYADVIFVLVGRRCDATNAELVSAVASRRLSNSVLLLGEREDVPALANAFDIGVLSSVSEGFPNAIGELMASGVPCVVTDVGDSRFLIGETGYTVPPGDAVALASAFDRLIRMGHEARRNLGSKARARVASLFSIASVASSFEALYSESASLRTLMKM